MPSTGPDPATSRLKVLTQSLCLKEEEILPYSQRALVTLCEEQEAVPEASGVANAAAAMAFWEGWEQEVGKGPGNRSFSCVARV